MALTKGVTSLLACQELAQQVLGPPVAHAPRAGYPTGHLHCAQIQQRHPGLETHPHARAIHLDHQLLGQVAGQIQVLQSIHQAGSPWRALLELAAPTRRAGLAPGLRRVGAGYPCRSRCVAGEMNAAG